MKKFEVIWVGENSQGMIYSGKEIVEAKNKIEAERKQKDPILFGTFQKKEK